VDVKTFWFDCETTGLDSRIHEAHQIAYLIEIDGEMVVSGELLIRPTRWDTISQEALDVSGVTIEQLRDDSRYIDPSKAHAKLLKVLEKYCNKYDRNDKFYPAGYNVSFDYGFLQGLFALAGDKYFGSWFNHRTIDLLGLVRTMVANGLLTDLQDHKLATVCQAYGVSPTKAHDAMADIIATKKLYRRMVAVVDGQVILRPPSTAAADEDGDKYPY
jgi:DNA polymerase-3 subunit epsilon